MQAMIISVFKRLQRLSVTGSKTRPSSILTSQAPEEPQLDAADVPLRMTAPDPTSGSIPAASTPAPEASTMPAMTRSMSHTSNHTASISHPTPTLSPSLTQVDEEPEARVETKPYGIPSIREVLRVLISLLNPHDQQHTDSMRLMALGLLNVAFEVGGRSVGKHSILRSLVADELCKYLFQVSGSSTYNTHSAHAIFASLPALRIRYFCQHR